LAWVIIGGLISSLFLTLIIVPVIYAIFDHWITRRKNKKQQKTIDELMVEEFVPAESEDGFTPVHAV
jgi:HAE1 family hydrophobic/amphiphilic exporter-1